MSEPDGLMVTILTIPEVADFLRVSENFVYKLITTERLRAIDLANPGARSKMRIRSDDLAEFLDRT